MDISELSQRVEVWACDIQYINAVVLFGSRAKGTATENSDWDICCLINENESEGWRGIWVCEADAWKREFCRATGLSESVVQFVAPTSPQVKAGLLECSKVLYVR